MSIDCRQNLLSSIAGSAQDLELLIDHPLYLPSNFEKVYNIISGISLGGHISWRLATSRAAARGKIHGLAIVIGCPNLTGLFLSGLEVDTAALITPSAALYIVPYDKLSAILNDRQRRLWPRAVSELLTELDRVTDENFPKNIPTCILNGKLDQLVPDVLIHTWVTKKRAEGYTNIKYLVYPNAEHICIREMVDMIAKWLMTIFATVD